MKVLLDTHVFLWLHADPARLGDHLAACEDPSNDLLVSAASSWEIVIKHALGKLELPEPPAVWLPERMRRAGATALPIQHEHALGVAALPALHRDPFDRMLVAQAKALDVPVMTADAAVWQYPVDTIRL